MSKQVGATVFELLEEAGERWLPPEVHQIFLFQIGGAKVVSRYKPSEAYWDRIQKILDKFFSSEERADICARLIGHQDLHTRPECRRFLAEAFAERRLQDLMAAPPWSNLSTADPARITMPARRPSIARR